jgi:hypothetical protein
MAIKGALQAADAPKWGEQDEKRFGDEVDMLAIDKTGSLVVIELKHGVNTSGIYWGPLQAGVYHAAFKDAPSEVYSGIKALIAQKIRLGLLPGAAAIMIPSALTLGDPMLAIAVPNRNSGCWDKMLEVCQKTRDWPLRVALIELQNGRSAIFQCEADRLALQCCMESIKGS